MLVVATYSIAFFCSKKFPVGSETSLFIGLWYAQMSAMDANEALLRPANNVGTIDRHARLAMFLSTPDYYESAV